jgi:hypothetical protein
MGVACAGGSAAAAFEALAKREWLGVDGIRFWFDEHPGEHVIANWSERSENRQVRVRLNHSSPGIFYVATPQTGGDQALIDDDGYARASGSLPFCPFQLRNAPVDRPIGARHRFLSESRFSSALRDALGVIKLNPLYDDWVKYIRGIRPELATVESIPVGDRDEPFMTVNEPSGRKVYPLAYAGDGFLRSLPFAADLAKAKGGVAAMDEPEAFAHPRMFSSIIKLIESAVKDGTQVVFATHSLEFVREVLTAFESDTKQTAVIGLRMEDGVLDPVVIEGPDAYRRVVEMGDDLRL